MFLLGDIILFIYENMKEEEIGIQKQNVFVFF